MKLSFSQLAFASVTMLQGVVDGCPYLSSSSASSVTINGNTRGSKKFHRRNLQVELTPGEAIADLKADILSLIEDDPDLGPKFLRLGFHDCVGGCDGCVNVYNVDNAGLDVPIDELESLVQEYAAVLIRTDVWATAALVAVDTAQESEYALEYDYGAYGRPQCDDPDFRRGPNPAMPGPHLTTGELLISSIRHLRSSKLRRACRRVSPWFGEDGLSSSSRSWPSSYQKQIGQIRGVGSSGSYHSGCPPQETSSATRGRVKKRVRRITAFCLPSKPCVPR